MERKIFLEANILNSKIEKVEEKVKDMNNIINNLSSSHYRAGWITIRTDLDHGSGEVLIHSAKDVEEYPHMLSPEEMLSIAITARDQLRKRLLHLRKEFNRL